MRAGPIQKDGRAQGDGDGYDTKPGRYAQFTIFDAVTKITSATAVESPRDYGDIDLATMLVS
mgnify:CR=1 FL=1